MAIHAVCTELSGRPSFARRVAADVVTPGNEPLSKFHCVASLRS
jgi:hypothetical protein